MLRQRCAGSEPCAARVVETVCARAGLEMLEDVHFIEMKRAVFAFHAQDAQDSQVCATLLLCSRIGQ